MKRRKDEMGKGQQEETPGFPISLPVRDQSVLDSFGRLSFQVHVPLLSTFHWQGWIRQQEGERTESMDN